MIKVAEINIKKNDINKQNTRFISFPASKINGTSHIDKTLTRSHSSLDDVIIVIAQKVTIDL